MDLSEYSDWKEIDIEWLKRLPKHWEISKFRYLFSLGRGLGVTKSDLLDEGVPCINYGEIHSKFGFEVMPEKHDLKYVSEDHIDSSPNSLLKNGDFVYADTSEDIEGSGNFAYLNSDIATFAGYHTVTAKPLTEDLSRFLAYLFDSQIFRFQIRKSVAGVKVFSITQDILKSCYVWLPPKNEQTQIANFLDYKTTQIDHLIEKKKALIEKLNEQRISMITQAVTKGLNPDVLMKDSEVDWLGEVPEHWQIKRLKFCVDLKNIKIAASNTDLFYLGLENVESQTGKLIYDFENPTISDGIGNYYKDGDVLFGKLRPYLAKSYVASSEGFCSTEFLVFQPFEFSSGFLHALILSDGFIKIVDSSTYGSKMPRASWDFIGNIEVPVPSHKEQKQIMQSINRDIERLDSIVDVNNKTIDRLNEYRTALITAAVTGQINVHNLDIYEEF